jgi:hypothetical protein
MLFYSLFGALGGRAVVFTVFKGIGEAGHIGDFVIIIMGVFIAFAIA